MSGIGLTDEQILELTPQERRDLVRRLTLPPEGFPTAETVHRIRRMRIALMIVSVLVLVPWTVYLAYALPDHYVADNWAVTWVGFDILLVAMLGATAVFGWLRRQLLFLTAFASGVLLVCDAWFDVLTSQPHDRLEAIASALLLELPLAVVLLAGPLRLMRYVAVRHGLLDAGVPLHRMPIPIPEFWPDQHIPRAATRKPASSHSSGPCDPACRHSSGPFDQT
ncbi:MAG TPA: hypothetical protein VGJ44_06990 [Kribbellaceae bacterium]